MPQFLALLVRHGVRAVFAPRHTADATTHHRQPRNTRNTRKKGGQMWLLEAVYQEYLAMEVHLPSCQSPTDGKPSTHPSFVCFEYFVVFSQESRGIGS
jgi:hypothetical protein